MRIVWDEPKRLANIDKHGMDFVDLDDGFFEAAVVIPAKGARLSAIGRSRHGILLVVFVRLGTEGVSIASMRPAGPKERKLIDG